jgi:hypothetical protein
MALQAASAPQVWQSEPFPFRLQLALPDTTAAEQDDDQHRQPGDHRLRPLEVAECSMCGIERPLGLLVPDGGGACTDVRWYCKDVKSCTERWTRALPDRSGSDPGAAGSLSASPPPIGLPPARLRWPAIPARRGCLLTAHLAG